MNDVTKDSINTAVCTKSRPGIWALNIPTLVTVWAETKGNLTHPKSKQAPLIALTIATFKLAISKHVEVFKEGQGYGI